MNTKTILIADDDTDLVNSLSSRCRDMGLQVEQASTAISALAKIDYVHPSVICLDIRMPPGNGLAVAEMLSDGDEEVARIPVILMTGDDDEETRRRANQMKVPLVRKGEGFWERLEAAIREALQRLPDDADGGLIPYRRKPPETAGDPAVAVEESLLGTVFSLLCDDMGLHNDQPVQIESHLEQPAPWVLTIDDDPDFSWALQKRLEKFGITVLRAFDGMQGYRSAFSRPVDAIICDYTMPNGKGDYILRRLKENPVTQDIPVIILTGRKDAALERTLINLGAVRVFTKPYKLAELVSELRQHIRLPSDEVRGRCCVAPEE